MLALYSNNKVVQSMNHICIADLWKLMHAHCNHMTQQLSRMINDIYHKHTTAYSEHHKIQLH